MTKTDDKHLICRNGNYSLKRHVPRQYQSIDNRREVWVSLHTDSLSRAKKKAPVVWDALIAGWEAQLAGGSPDAKQNFEAAQKLAKSKGLEYMQMPEVMNLPDREILARIKSIGRLDGKLNEMEAAAVLGRVDVPSITVSEALEEFWELAKDQILGKSADQIRRWKNPRIKAFKNFIAVIGDKPIADISQDDMLDFRNWWMERVEYEKLNVSTANKDFTNFGSVLKSVNKMKKLGLEIPLRGFHFKKGRENSRPPFSEEWIREKLLAKGALADLEDQARTILLVMINTGARLSEAANLMPAHIILDHEYPHIVITSDGREQAREMKSPNAERVIPLVGVSLDAMRKCPDGFPKYHDDPTLSDMINRYLTNHGLRETPKHTAYSLRHSFEDRLRKAKIDDRLRAELFGHSYHRERYGATTLEELTEALSLIAI